VEERKRFTESQPTQKALELLSAAKCQLHQTEILRITGAGSPLFMASAAERFVADAEVLADPLVEVLFRPISTESLILLDCHWSSRPRGRRKTTNLQ
jgi:hypothetical protein